MEPIQLDLTLCSVRSWRRGDELSLVRHANNRAVWINLRDLFPFPYTVAEARRWVNESARFRAKTTFAVVVDELAVGGVGLHVGQDIYRRSAEIGYWLGEEFWGRGIMTEVVMAVTEYGFRAFDLARVWAEVFEWNPASMRVLEKAGFEREGKLRKSAFKDGRVIDQYLYAKTSGD